MIGGSRWRPDWGKDGEVRDEAVSAAYVLSSDLGATHVARDILVYKGRGAVGIDNVNPEGFAITFDDDSALGGDWYSVGIRLEERH